ncbi:MAG: DUF4026 domain-containing protein [Succinivibrio dextrinosolvens]|nr:DUF4026 domain-containing protein [Succinivibrio dextrinosolvens]
MKESSYMIIIPKHEEDMHDPKKPLENLMQSVDIQIKDINTDEERGLILTLKIDDNVYEVDLDPTEVEIPDMVRPAHAFSEEELKQIDEARMGLGISMEFNGSSTQCFYDQIRIINALFPDEILAVMDCPAEKLLSGKWVSFAAKSRIPPSPRYLFTVQAVSNGDDEIWLHTHGLRRCGLYELEILCSSKNMYEEHYRIIETFAFRMLDDDERIEPGEAVFIGQAADMYLVCTAVDWREALKFYPKATVGTAEDRAEDEDNYHSEDTYVLMMYMGPDDAEAKAYTPVQEFDPYLEQNPMFMISNEETKRMSDLAIERIPYMIKAAEDKENVIIVKIALQKDKEFIEEDSEKEHIWFELKEIKKDSIVAELTQEAYYVKGIKEGDIGTYPFEAITDWEIFSKGNCITPDDVYRLA